MKNYHQPNIKFYNFALFCLAFFSIFVPSARAATIEKIEFEQSSKIIQITGSCAGHTVAVHIFSASSTEPFYTAGGDCQEGMYFFKDSLSYWKFDAGDYGVKVYDANSPLTDPSNEEYFKVEDALSYAPPATTTETTTPFEPPAEDSPEDAVPPGSSGDNGARNNEAPPGLLFRLIEAISDWFKSAIVFIKELTAEKITAPKICVGETCIIENQLKELLGKDKEPAKEETVVPQTSGDTESSATDTLKAAGE